MGEASGLELDVGMGDVGGVEHCRRHIEPDDVEPAPSEEGRRAAGTTSDVGDASRRPGSDEVGERIEHRLVDRGLGGRADLGADGLDVAVGRCVVDGSRRVDVIVVSHHSTLFASARLPERDDRLVAVVDPAPLLRLDGLTKRYPGTTALDNLSLELPRGRIGLVGANGAGKTTTFRLLLGLAHPTHGRIEVCGIDVARDPIGVRARLGYMPEHDCLPLDQTASDVVSTFGELSGLPPRAARQRASDILDLVGLHEARFRPIGGFSTGMRQRTKLAQAIVGDPELVLLDEPTAGLDPLGREDMLTLVARLGSFDISVVMATHLLDDVQRVCDHVVMIDGGRLVVSGATDALLERTGTVTVDVGPRRDELVAALRIASLPAAVAEGYVEVAIDGDAQIDLLRDVIADLGLPLYRLTSRLTSLDEVFLERAEGAL